MQLRTTFSKFFKANSAIVIENVAQIINLTSEKPFSGGPKLFGLVRCPSKMPFAETRRP
jgi:hypothetical protein